MQCFVLTAPVKKTTPKIPIFVQLTLKRALLQYEGDTVDGPTVCTGKADGFNES